MLRKHRVTIDATSQWTPISSVFCVNQNQRAPLKPCHSTEMRKKKKLAWCFFPRGGTQGEHLLGYIGPCRVKFGWVGANKPGLPRCIFRFWSSWSVSKSLNKIKTAEHATTHKAAKQQRELSASLTVYKCICAPRWIWLVGSNSIYSHFFINTLLFQNGYETCLIAF